MAGMLNALRCLLSAVAGNSFEMHRGFTIGFVATWLPGIQKTRAKTRIVGWIMVNNDEQLIVNGEQLSHG